MISQITKTLVQLFRPVATSKSSSDRDPAGSTYEKHSDRKSSQQDESEAKDEKEPSSQESPAATARIIPFPGARSKPEPQDPSRDAAQDAAREEARMRALGTSQVWVDLMGDLEKQRESQKTGTAGETASAVVGTSAYEKANTGVSKASQAKKGVILDKKAA